MYEILVSGHYPPINGQNIARDVSIEIVLNKAIDTLTVKPNSVIVTDYLYHPVKGEVSWAYTNAGTPSGIPNILTFKPETFLDPETTYIVTIPKYPDSVRAIDDSFIQESYSYRFYTGINSTSNNQPTYSEQLEMDLAQAIANEDWCLAATIQAKLDGLQYACGIPISGAFPTLPDNLEIIDTYPKNIESNIYLDKLQFIKLTFNDIMPASGIDYSYYINVIAQNVLE
jgi:hypothetical protein